MTMEPHVAGVHEAGVTGAAGAEGALVADVDEPDIPPPQALKVAISTMHAATGGHRRRFTHAGVARGEQCIEISSFC
jgi:hypothetical protein